MKDFDQILDECIEQILDGSSSLEELLSRYPEQASQLEPLLRAAIRLERSREMLASDDFKSGARLQLIQHMRAHPRSPLPERRLVPPLRVAFSLTALVLAMLASGTAFAQGSLPGDSFYSWKIASEHALRAVWRDPVGIDLFLAERRVQEFRSVSADPQRSERALQGYNEVLLRLNAEADTQTRQRIEPVLVDHEKSWKQSGVTIPALEKFLAGKSPSQAGSTPDASMPSPAGEQQPQPPDAAPTQLPVTATSAAETPPQTDATALVDPATLMPPTATATLTPADASPGLSATPTP